MAIKQFRGQYFPFSNMYPLERPILTEITPNVGVWVPTSEHVYMAERLADPFQRIKVAHARAELGDDRLHADGLAAKRLAHYLIHRGAVEAATSDDERIALMTRAVRMKLERNDGIRSLLISTGNEEIIEGNNHGDRFWGVDPIGSTNGRNNLGKILMRLRKELQPE